MTETLNQLLPLLIGYGVRVLGALIALWLSFRVANWFSRKLVASLRAKDFDETLAIFFGGILRYIILIAAIIACLGLFGIETTSFAAILGAGFLVLAAMGLRSKAGDLEARRVFLASLLYLPFLIVAYLIG